MTLGRTTTSESVITFRTSKLTFRTVMASKKATTKKIIKATPESDEEEEVLPLKKKAPSRASASSYEEDESVEARLNQLRPGSAGVARTFEELVARNFKTTRTSGDKDPHPTLNELDKKHNLGFASKDKKGAKVLTTLEKPSEELLTELVDIILERREGLGTWVQPSDHASETLTTNLAAVMKAKKLKYGAKFIPHERVKPGSTEIERKLNGFLGADVDVEVALSELFDSMMDLSKAQKVDMIQSWMHG